MYAILEYILTYVHVYVRKYVYTYTKTPTACHFSQTNVLNGTEVVLFKPNLICTSNLDYIINTPPLLYSVVYSLS